MSVMAMFRQLGPNLHRMLPDRPTGYAASTQSTSGAIRLEIPATAIAVVGGGCVDQYIGTVCRTVDDEPETHRIFSGVGYREVIFTRRQIAKIKSARVVNHHISHLFTVSNDVAFIFG